MHLKKQKQFIIQILYYSIIMLFLYTLCKLILYRVFPIFLGILIACSLRPLVKKTTQYLSISQKFISTLYVCIFYLCIASIVFVLWIQCTNFLMKCIEEFPIFYEHNIQPFFMQLIHMITQQIRKLDFSFSNAIHFMFLEMQTHMHEFIMSQSSTVLHYLTTWISTLPSLIFSFLLTILSSLFVSIDFSKISCFIMRQIPKHHWNTCYQIKDIIVKTIQNYVKAYLKLMLLTALQLYIGFQFLQIKNALKMAIMISFFDSLPFIGTGIVMLPWACFLYLNQQKKLAIGLCIVHLTINLLRQFLEPKIVGKQLGIHPLLLMIGALLGFQFFGVFGIFLSPIVLQIIQQLNHHNIIRLYKE